VSKTDESRLDTLAVNTGKTVECLLEECGLPLACACIRDALRVAYAAGLAAAKPTGWRVEIASIQERPLSPERLWKCELYNHDTSILSWSIPHTSKAGLKQYLKPLIDFLHAEVRVVPMEKKGDEL